MNSKKLVNLPILQTQRLILRKIMPEDAADVFEYGSDPLVTRFVTWSTHQSIDDSKNFIDFILEQYWNGYPSSWGIILKEKAKLIGTLGIVAYEPVHARIEIGYVINRNYWGEGMTTEAVKAFIEYCFTDLGVNRVEAKCFPENIASARVMEKSGLTYEGLLRQYALVKGVYQDLKTYAILREDWLKNYLG